MKRKPLVAYFVVLVFLCTAFIVGAKMVGQYGSYLAQGYMITPAIAALVTRIFFYTPKFKDANLRFGRIQDYFKFWLMSIGVTILSYLFYTLLGAISWDFSGQYFLDGLGQQFAGMGQDIRETLPPGFTPRMMMFIFFVSGLTVFNILPGIITGFGEEFGHRGFMFPQLYKIKSWVGIIVGGLIWYAWHLPLMLVIPQTVQYPLGQTILNMIVLAIGSVCTFTYLAYVYTKSESIWVTSIAHITLNNSAAAFAYFVIIHDQLLANLGLALTMVFVVVVLFYTKQLNTYAEYFSKNRKEERELPPRNSGDHFYEP